ncbi:MAG: CpsB/CapC family capsule biosynthesis tyrosine phosphatase [Eubacteriales bacterium]
MTCDAHIHLLPGLDDGAADVDESILMLRKLVSLGMRAAVLTPHLRMGTNTIETFLVHRKAAYQRLRKTELIQKKQFKCFLSVEMEACEGFSRLPGLDRLLSPELPYLPLALPLGGMKGWLMEELSYLLHKRKICPLFLHTERYLIFYPEKDKQKLLSFPHAAYQFTLASFRYLSIAKTALQLYRNDKLVLLGSNGHNIGTRLPEIDLDKLYITESLAKIAAENIMRSNDEYFNRFLES